MKHFKHDAMCRKNLLDLRALFHSMVKQELINIYMNYLVSGSTAVQSAISDD